MWLDDCRIPFVDEGDRGSIDRSDRNVMMGWKTDSYVNGVGNNTLPPEQAQGSPLGRFTPNLLVCDDMLNDGNITKKSNPKITPVGIGRGVIGNHDGRKTITKAKEGMEMLRSVGDGGSNSRFYDLDKWFDKMIDEIQ